MDLKENFNCLFILSTDIAEPESFFATPLLWWAICCEVRTLFN
jgi:hypothetical protein